MREEQCIRTADAPSPRRNPRLRRALPFTAALLVVVALAAWLFAFKPHPVPSAAVQRIFQAQSRLAPEAVRALQDLRLVAAVQMAYFTSAGRYGSVEELKRAGYLDPVWPRAGAYRVSCEYSPGSAGFVCWADPAPPLAIFFRVDATQAVRYAKGHRPDGRSPVFGIHQEGL